MQESDNSNNLRLWREMGANLLVVQPFMDSVIVRGEGCYLIDADGQRILDLAAGQFCSILGHNDPEFIAKLQTQMARIVHLGDQYVSPEVMKAASRLAAVAPGSLNKVILLSTGSEANECAMRIAKAATGRTGMLGFTRGYYGISLATHNLSSISDHPGKHDFQPSPASQFKLMTPTCSNCPLQRTYPGCDIACLDASLEYVSSQVSNIAAVIVEPVVSAGGMIFPPTGYLKKLREVTRALGMLLIVDEAQTGFGRCGQWFDIQNHGIDPDILVVSKTAGNGYPAAAVVVSDAVARQLESGFFTHLSSHQNDPLAAAVVLAVIDAVEERDLVSHSREMGAYFLAGLERLREKHPIVADVRGRGLMIGVELASEKGGGGELAFTAAMLCERKGVHLTFSYFEPVLRIIPPLIISRAEIDFALQVLDDVLRTLEAGDADLLRLIPQNSVSGALVRGTIKSSPAALLRKMWVTSPRQWVNKLKSKLPIAQ
jgi:2,2-dialkylglycine decarboxylase (pyruvate)